jgi:hypothetical protein
MKTVNGYSVYIHWYSKRDLVRRAANTLKKPTEADLARLRAAQDGPIDLSEIPEAQGAPSRVVRRDRRGRLEPTK